MKVAFITFEYPPFIIGGAGTYAKNISENLAKLGHEVFVFTPDIYNIKNGKKKNLNIVRIKMNKFFPLKALQFWFKLRKEIKKFEKDKKFDIIHINGISYFSLKMRITNASQTVFIHHPIKDTIVNDNLGFFARILHFRGEDGFLILKAEDHIIKSSDKIIVPSKFTKNNLLSHYKLNSSLITVIHEGISCDNFKEALVSPLKESDFILLFVGRVDDHRKGLDILLDAFRIVSQKFEDVKLIIVGSGNNKKVVKLSEKLNIQNRILFTGFVDESTLKSYYNICDIYVTPSRLEGFGLTILEAMAAGKSVIGFRVGSIPELIKNYKNGVLIDKVNAEALANGICYLLENSVHWDKKEIQRFVKENYNWKKAAIEHEKCFETIIYETQN